MTSVNRKHYRPLVKPSEVVPDQQPSSFTSSLLLLAATLGLVYLGFVLVRQYSKLRRKGKRLPLHSYYHHPKNGRDTGKKTNTSMGFSCSKLTMDDNDDSQHGGGQGGGATFAHNIPPPSQKKNQSTNASASSKPNDSRRQSLRRSIFRVGSRVDRKLLGSSNRSNLPPKTDDDMPQSPRARASTYSHVHDAVMYNLSEAEVSKHDQSVPMGVIGLKNLGNTCFMNSSLQCLSATIPLTDYFLGYDYRSEINKDNFLGTGGKLAVAYAELMKQMWLGSKSVINLSKFKKQLETFAPQFSGFHQHDAQELLSFLLDGIHEDLNRVDVNNRPYIEDKDCDGTNDEEDAITAWRNYLQRNRSLIVDLFQGQIRNTCKCLTCGHVNIRFEPFMYLSVPISDRTKTLDECMDKYLEEETLTGADQWYCEKCKKHVDATKKIDLWILPPILIVHLKRFRYNEYGKVASKTDTAISYPVERWDLRSRKRSRAGVYPSYDLYAVANHMGTTSGGHYTALAMNRFDDMWYEFNDSSYRSVEQSIHRRHRKSAYLLFYNRSEGDRNVPLNERSPVIRRQSVTRPELWPHRQIPDRDHVREYTRSSVRKLPTDSVLSKLGTPSLNTSVGGNGSGLDPEVSSSRSRSASMQDPPGDHHETTIQSKGTSDSDRSASSAKKASRRAHKKHAMNGQNMDDGDHFNKKAKAADSSSMTNGTRPSDFTRSKTKSKKSQ